MVVVLRRTQEYFTFGGQHYGGRKPYNALMRCYCAMTLREGANQLRHRNPTILIFP